MSNPRFAEYATSGAFTLTLTRSQVSTLAMTRGGAPAWGGAAGSLERKGLVEVVAKPADHHRLDEIEFRPTMAGLHCLSLLQEAGLTNGPDDPVAEELRALRQETEARRIEAVNARRDGRSALARLDEAEAELREAQRELKDLRAALRGGPRLKEAYRAFQAAPEIRLRDPTPERSTEELRAALEITP